MKKDAEFKNFKGDLKRETEKNKEFEKLYNHELVKLRVAQRLIEIREKMGLTQAELAGRMRVSQQLISRVEGGADNITLETLVKFLEALGASISIKFSIHKKNTPTILVA